MKVSIACCCIITDNARPIPDAWISAVPIGETPQWIIQAALDSSQSIDCRPVEPNIQQVSFIMAAGYGNIYICRDSDLCVLLCISPQVRVMVMRMNIYQTKLRGIGAKSGG
jgi:hypothetical protein